MAQGIVMEKYKILEEALDNEVININRYQQDLDELKRTEDTKRESIIAQDEGMAADATEK
jgi:hypothetical protein